jgi:hypothetical protein
MKAKAKHIKYLVDVEEPYDQFMDNVITLCKMPLVKDVTLVDSDVTLADVAGTIQWNVDGLQYQYEQRGN